MPVPTKFDTKDIVPLDGAPAKFDTSQIQPIDHPGYTPQPGDAEIKADTRGKATAWLDDLDADLRQGGNRTFLGRTLGHAQGRGEKGFSGMESGVSKGAADFVGGVPLGAVKAAQGIAEMHDHPVKGALKSLGGVLQAAQVPLSFVGGPIVEAGAEALPSRQYAMSLFKDVSENAGNVPVSFSRSGDAILRARELADAGTSMPQSVGKLLQRITDPSKKPLTYDEARDFYTNISSLSANESSRLSPVMKRQIGIIAKALRDDIGDSAAQAGQAAKYYAAMKNYAQASKLLRAVHNIKEFLAKPVVTKVAEGVGLGAGGAIGYEAYKHLK